MDRHTDLRGLIDGPFDYFDKALDSIDLKGGFKAVSDGITEHNKTSAVSASTQQQLSLTAGQVPVARAKATATKTRGTISVDPIRFEREWLIRMQKFAQGR